MPRERTTCNSQGLKFGDRVTAYGKEYSVCGFDTYEYWIMGNPILKNGSIGKFSRNLYHDWTKKETA